MPSTDAAQQLEQKIDDATEKLLEQIAAGKTEHLLELERVRALFWKYSWGNQLLIALRCPDASYVAGFRKWVDMGASPRKGENIQILAPNQRKIKDADTGEERYIITGFHVVSVWDVSGVDNAPNLPTFFENLGDCDQSLIDFIVNQMEADKIKVDMVDRMIFGAEGVSSGGHVEVKNGAPGINKAAVLIHEWAHEILHQSIRLKDEKAYLSMSSRQKECHAESVSYIVMQALGFEVSHSSDYIIHWGSDKDSFLAEMSWIQRGAKHILDRMSKYQSGGDNGQIRPAA